MKKSFELEDYKRPFHHGVSHCLLTKWRTGHTGFWYKFLTLFPQHKPDLKKPSDMTRIIKAFHGNMIQGCVENRAGVEFPERLGVLLVGSFKSKELIDYGTSSKLLKKVYHRNLHTDGLAASIYYDTSACNYVHHELWEFNPCVNFRSVISKAFRKNWRIYIRLESIWRASKLRRKSFMKNYAIKKQNELLKDYNEFYVI